MKKKPLSILTYQEIQTQPFGKITLLFSQKGICRLYWGNISLAKKDPYLIKYFQPFSLTKENRIHPSIHKFIQGYCSKKTWKKNLLDRIPLDLRGTRFQKRVWQELAKISMGETQTYSAIARRIKKPKAVRALGGACGANPIPLLIPCHRVIGYKSLGGFSAGISLKKNLLNHEGSGVC